MAGCHRELDRHKQSPCSRIAKRLISLRATTIRFAPCVLQGLVPNTMKSAVATPIRAHSMTSGSPSAPLESVTVKGCGDPGHVRQAPATTACRYAPERYAQTPSSTTTRRAKNHILPGLRSHLPQSE